MPILADTKYTLIMRKVLLVMVFAIMFGSALDAQTKIVKDSTGNYVTVAASKKSTTKSEDEKWVVNGKVQYFTIKDKKYPIYVGSKGGKYVIRTSKKSGNQYKQYLKVEGEK